MAIKKVWQKIDMP